MRVAIFFTVGLTICVSDTFSSESSKPVFNRPLEDSYSLPRKQLKLKCQATGFPIPTITWLKDGEIVQTQRDQPGTSNRITNHGELLFLSFGPDDEGQYRCNASNTEGWTLSRSAQVRAAFFNPENAVGPKSRTVYAGDPVDLHCLSPVGLPPPRIFWTRGSELIEKHSRIRVETTKLTIDAASLLDSGTYKCHAENMAGYWESKGALLTVQRKPRFRFTPGKKQALVGEDVEFHCLASDDPNSTIIWKREAGEIPRTSYLNRKSLRIENVHLSDTGNYVCEAKTSVGIMEAIAYLSVISPPSFLVTPDDREVSIGEIAHFDCLTSGTPSPVVRWLHNRKVIWVPRLRERTYDDGKYVVFSNGTLLVTTVSATDEGLYECKASQIARFVKSSAYLTVRTGDYLPAPIILIGPQNRTLKVGAIAILPCVANVIRHPLRDNVHLSTSPVAKFPPELSTEWLFNGIRLSSVTNPRLASFHSGSLQISNIRPVDSGVYTCRATVDGMLRAHPQPRSTSWSAYVEVTDTDVKENTPIHFQDHVLSVPPPPDKVVVLEVGDNWATLEITPPINSTEFSIHTARSHSMSGFQVEIMPYNSTLGWEVVLPFVVDTRVQIGSLSPETDYLILVRSVIDHIIGRPFILDSILRTTSPILMDTQGSVSLASKFEQISLSYIGLRTISPSEILVECLLCGPLDSLPLVTGLRVSAKTVPLSHCLKTDSQQSVTLREAYSHVQVNQSNCWMPMDSLEHEFLDDNELLHCSLAEAFRDAALDVEVPYILDHEATAPVSLSDLKTLPILRVAVDALRPFICYTVVVEVVSNHNGFNRSLSKKGPAATVLTYDSTPSGAPKVYSTRLLQNGTVLEVGWNPPTEWESGGFLTGYQIRIFSSTSKFNKKVKIGPDQRSFNIQNLDLWTNYTIYLAAVNCRGEGVRSPPIHVFACSLHDGTTVLEQPLFRRVIHDGQETRVDNRIPKLPVSNLGDFVAAKEPMENLTREPWFVISVITFFLLWIVIALGLVLCSRHRSRRQRRSDHSSDSVSVTKNGRIITEDRLSNHFAASWPSTGPIESHPLVSAFETNYYGDKVLTGNGYQAQMNPNEGLISGIGLNELLTAKGPTHAGVPVGYAYAQQYSVGSPHSGFGVSTSLAMNVSTNDIRHPVSMPPGGRMPFDYDHMTGARITSTKFDKEDAVTPYASVPVMQQMLLHNPSGPNTAPVDHRNTSRQFLLAKIIPPPPDYPPPALPLTSGLPSDRCIPWSSTAGSGSGDDSAYYAQSELQTAFSQHSATGPQTASVQWSGSLPTSDEGSHVPSRDSSHTGGSQHLTSVAPFALLPNTTRLTSEFAS